MATFSVINTDDSGSGSLRQAIIDANNSTGPDMIAFSIGSGVQTIRPQSPLPEITDAVVIDASTQPGFSGTPLIELVGSNAGTGANGLVISAGNSTVKGLAIGSFSGNAISLLQLGNNLIAGNFLGIDAGLRNRGNGGEGVNISSSDGNTITGNTIAFNRDGGSIIDSSDNIIRDNNIGTDATMTREMGNLGAGFGFANASNNRLEGNRVFFNQIGFFGFGGAGNTIGGLNLADGNIIGRNGTGVLLNNSNGNAVKANFIGTNPSGADMGNEGSGVELAGTSSNNNIGGSTLSQGNTIAFNQTGINAFTLANGNLYLLNSIFNNTLSGINNNSGANRNINPPQLLSATSSETDTLINGRLIGLPNRQYLLQFHLGPDSPIGEGKTPIGGFAVTTTPGGFVDFSGRFPSPLSALKLTALATDLTTNDTSQFSNGIAVMSTAQPDLEVKKTGPERAKCGDVITWTIEVRNIGTAAAVGAKVTDTLPACVADQVTVATMPEGLLSFPRVGNQVLTLVPRLDPGASVTITITATLTEDCAELIANLASGSADGDSNPSNNAPIAQTMVDCVKITGFTVQGKHVRVSGLGFQKGDQIEINGLFGKKTKFIDIDELLAKKAGKNLLPCDPANPGRTNVIRLIRNSNPFSPVQDTQAFATCP